MKRVLSLIPPPGERAKDPVRGRHRGMDRHRDRYTQDTETRTVRFMRQLPGNHKFRFITDIQDGWKTTGAGVYLYSILLGLRVGCICFFTQSATKHS